MRDISGKDLRSGARDIEHAYYGGPGEQMPSSVGPLPPFPLVAPMREGKRSTRGNGRAAEFFEFAPREPAKGRGGERIYFLLSSEREKERGRRGDWDRIGFADYYYYYRRYYPSSCRGRVDFFSRREREGNIVQV